jgi:chromosome segregation ATPase
MATEVSVIKNDYVTKNEKAVLETGISEAKASASAADQKAENAQKEVDALETVVGTLSNDLTNFGTNVANTYETKQDANIKQTNLSNAITGLQDGAVKTNAENITKEAERATAAENALDGKITALNTTVTNLSTNTS